ncbi:hypothetical protein [Pseudonocardia dioxanivorans]|uniref:hypothetical protein n=1 Tax=Pseudonocardia dioxanivorans TaxID=240495 RepID=UPI000CD1BAE2|nr:hypothetical protein [Pseudonocardia dioxanivorans]
MRPARARSAALVVVWLGAAVGALVVGLTAVGAIGSGITGEGLRPLTPAEVDTRLAALPPSAPPSAPPSSSPLGRAAVVAGAPGGTVVARCDATTPRVVSASPAQGFEVDDAGDDSGDHPGRVRFESDDTRVEVRLSCVDGAPAGEVRVERHG